MVVVDEYPTNQKEERKLNDTYLGGKETWRKKGEKKIKNYTSIRGNEKEKMKRKSDAFPKAWERRKGWK